MRNSLVPFALATTLVAAACGGRQVIAVPAVDVEKPGAMTVTGTATMDVSPDCADLTMTISVDAPKPGAATSEVQVKETALVEALGKLGVSNDDLKLSHLSLEPVYTYNPMHLDGYRADITVMATTRDFSKIATLMEAGANNGATAMTSAFRRSDLATIKSKVRDLAITAARDKAKQTATALGIPLGRITAVSEAPSGSMWGNAYFPNAQVSNTSSRTLAGTSETLSLDVTIAYELTKA